jgi:hypothetical protein
MSPVKYKLGFYIPEDGIPHSQCCENLKSNTSWVYKCNTKQTTSGR